MVLNRVVGGLRGRLAVLEVQVEDAGRQSNLSGPAGLVSLFHLRLFHDLIFLLGQFFLFLLLLHQFIRHLLLLFQHYLLPLLAAHNPVLLRCLLFLWFLLLLHLDLQVVGRGVRGERKPSRSDKGAQVHDRGALERRDEGEREEVTSSLAHTCQSGLG